MDTFSVKDLRLRTGELVKDAEAGQLSVVTKSGRPLFVAVPFDETLVREGIHVALAVKLFQEAVLTPGQAARLANRSLENFIETLGRLGISVVDYPIDELDQELRFFE